VVLRKLSEIHDLNRKISQLWSGAKQPELPSQSPKFLFGKPLDKASCEKAKMQVQKYLEVIILLSSITNYFVLEDFGDVDIGHGPRFEVNTCDRHRLKAIIKLSYN